MIRKEQSVMKDIKEKRMIGYTDIHNHALPHLDDGAKNIVEALSMIQLCYEEGIRCIIFTPHIQAGNNMCSKEQIHYAFEQLINKIKETEKLTKMEFYLGSEIYYSSDCIEKLSENTIHTLAGSSYVLVEFNVYLDFPSIRNALYNLLANGYKPILAHVERYDCLLKTFLNVEDLINMGVYLQVNTTTILGKMGHKRKRFAKKLLKREYIAFLGTDAHDPKKRAPKMKTCARYIKTKVREEYLTKLLLKNPQSIIMDQYI